MLPNLWGDHGTKVLGVLVLIHSGLLAAEAEFHALLPPLGDTLFDLGVKFGGAVLGLGVIKRGFTNSKAAP